jgi:cytochrome b
MLKKHLVWDLPTRLFHWLLVLSLLTQWITAEVGGEYMEWHFLSGYFTLGLILFRLIWGFCGTKYARFSNFIVAPSLMIRYTKQFLTKTNPSFTGHNPLGGLFVPSILMLVGLQAFSGLFISDDVLYSGPYNSMASDSVLVRAEWLHHNIFDVIIGIAAVHILAVLWYQFGLKRELIGAMFHGKKSLVKTKGVTSSRIILGFFIALLVTAFVYWLIVYNAPVGGDDYYY